MKKSFVRNLFNEFIRIEQKKKKYYAEKECQKQNLKEKGENKDGNSRLSKE